MSSEGDFLEAAGALGYRIASDAIWDHGRCSWVGVYMDPKEAWHPEYRALEANVYDGTAGVALFLAELAAVTGDGAIRRTAVGAMRHAVMRAPASRREGFHAGSLGIAWAAARVAAVLGEEELHDSARKLPAAAAPVQDGCVDLVLGSAGSMIARLKLADIFDDAELLEDARATGRQLLAHATVTRHGWSWASSGHRRRRHLCGVSHGAGGIGWALLELFVGTGEERFRTGAEGAFAYERSWLHASTGSWPDLRIGGQRRGATPPAPAPTAGTWCHGEAGIALVRLRGIETLGSEQFERDAAIALEATRRRLAAALPYDIDDMTLCHGASGAAEALLCGGDHEAAAELARVALERYGATGRWPCGPVGGTTPTLFRGLSGIGWWMLRLHDSSIQSPLTLPVQLTRVGVPA